MTYAVRWRENGGPARVGSLELTHGEILLSGAGAGAAAAHLEVRCDELLEIYLERPVRPNPEAEPVLMLVTRAGERIAIGSLDSLGVLHELAEGVAGARAHAVG